MPSRGFSYTLGRTAHSGDLSITDGVFGAMAANRSSMGAPHGWSAARGEDAKPRGNRRVAASHAPTPRRFCATRGTADDGGMAKTMPCGLKRTFA